MRENQAQEAKRDETLRESDSSSWWNTATTKGKMFQTGSIHLTKNSRKSESSKNYIFETDWKDHYHLKIWTSLSLRMIQREQQSMSPIGCDNSVINMD